MRPTSLKSAPFFIKVHAASVMISGDMDTSLEAMFCITFLVSTSPACSVIVDQVFHSCRDDGLRLSDCRVHSDTCFGDVLHLVTLPENLRTRAVVIILTLFFFFSKLRDI